MRKRIWIFFVLFFVFFSNSSFSISRNHPNKSHDNLTFFNSNHRIIEFADQFWHVESYMDEKVNPGPNYFSDDEDLVWVDNHGFLNLTIKQNSAGEWLCSSIKSIEAASYGTHRFKIIGNLETLDKNLVLGLFMYRIDQDNPNLRAEVDIELSTWSFPTHIENELIHPTANAHYTLWKPWTDFCEPQPYAVEPFMVKMPRGTHTTHEIYWDSRSLSFLSYHGHAPTNPNKKIIHSLDLPYDRSDSWVIPHENEKMHIMINFWICSGNDAPSDENKEHHFKVKYEFEPQF